MREINSMIGRTCTAQDAPCSEETVKSFIASVLHELRTHPAEREELMHAAHYAAEKIAKIERWDRGTLSAVITILERIGEKIAREEAI